MSERQAKYAAGMVRTAKEKQPKRTMPDELRNILRASRDKFSDAFWELADILSDVEVEFGEPLPRGECADDLGMMPSQVSELIMTRKRISPELQAKYEGLPFSVFKFAARDESPADVLRMCLESADKYGGQPGTVRVVRAIVKERKGGSKKDERRVWSGQVSNVTYSGHYVSFDVRIDTTDDKTKSVVEGMPMTVREV